MTWHIALTLGLLVLALVVFVFEWISVDVMTLLVVAALVVSGILSPGEAFAGLASEIIVVLACIFILSGALTRTRVLDGLGRALARFGGRSRSRAVLGLTSLCASASAFVNNTNATAVLMPAVYELSRRTKITPSRLLMPLAFASILGGTCTLVGTSTNMAASGMLERLGFSGFGLFELTAAGVPMAVLGVLWLSLVGYRMLPEGDVASLSEAYAIHHYLASIAIDAGSPLVGQTVREAAPLAKLGLYLATVIRRGHKIFPQPELSFEEGDLLVVQGSREAIVAAKESADLRLEADVLEGDDALYGDEIRLMEAVVLPRSALGGRSLRELRFRQRFGIAVLAVYRPSHRRDVDIRDLAFEVGDVLLLQGPEERLRSLQGSRDVWLLGELEHLPGRQRKGVLTLGALVGAVLVGAAGWLPLSVALLLAAIAVVLLRVVSPDEVYGLVEWRLLILIGGMTAMGLAMQKTGAADLLATWIVSVVLPFGVLSVLGAFALLAMILTQPLSNAAAALVLLPIAVSTAQQLDVNPRTFAAMVTLAASLSFVTPFEPSCLLVYRPGRYRFVDFVRAGSLLSILGFVTLMALVPAVWPL